MAMKHSYYEALAEGFSADQAKKVFEGRGYRWAQRFPAGDVQLQEEIWELPGGRGAVRYIFDHYVEVPFIKAETDLPNEATNILGDLSGDLPLISQSDLRRQAKSTAPEVFKERVYALRALAAVISKFDWGVVNIFLAALKDPSPGIRLLVLRCISRYPYYVFVEDLDALVATESDGQIREEAARLASDLREHGRKGTL